MKNYCLNYLSCGNEAAPGSDLCAECQPKPIDRPAPLPYVDKHAGERMSRGDRLRVNREHRRGNE